jgi:hypothetical protein
MFPWAMHLSYGPQELELFRRRAVPIRVATGSAVPMAAAFARPGWVNFENSINMAWD